MVSACHQICLLQHKKEHGSIRHMRRPRFNLQQLRDAQIQRLRERGQRLRNLRTMERAAQGARSFRPGVEYLILGVAVLLLLGAIIIGSTKDPVTPVSGPGAPESATTITATLTADLTASATLVGTPGYPAPGTGGTSVASNVTSGPSLTEGPYPGPGAGSFPTGLPPEQTVPGLDGTQVASGDFPTPVFPIDSPTSPSGDFFPTSPSSDFFPTSPPPGTGTGSYPPPGTGTGSSDSDPAGFTPVPTFGGPYPGPGGGVAPPPVATTARPAPTARAGFTPVPPPPVQSAPTPRPPTPRPPSPTPLSQVEPTPESDPYPDPGDEPPVDDVPTTAPGGAATPTQGFTSIPTRPAPTAGDGTEVPPDAAPTSGNPAVATPTLPPTNTAVPPTATPIPPTATPTPVPLTVLRGNVRWTASDSPVVLDRNTVLAPNSSLVVDPGVEVQLGAGVQFFVQGSLQAQGAPGAPVRFTGPSGRWAGLFGQPGSAISLSHVEVRGGGRGGVAVSSEGGSLTIADSLITDGGGGISTSNAAVNISRTRVIGNDLATGPAIMLMISPEQPVTLAGNVVGGNQIARGTPQVKLEAGENGGGPLQIEGNLLYGTQAAALDLTTGGPLRGVIRCNSFQGGTEGLAVNSSTPSASGFALAIDNNAFVGQASYGASSTVALSGAQNWWNAPSGPYDAARNAEGQGVRVGVNLAFEPWLDAAPACAPTP